MIGFRLTQRARNFYAKGLRAGEEIRAVRLGYAARTATLICAGAALGGVIGWLYSIYTEGALLPAMIVGLFVGIIGSYFYAEGVARRPSGPGATTFRVAVTTERVLTLRRYAALRPRILRSFERTEITGIETHRYPIGHYHHTRISSSDGTTTAFVIDGPLGEQSPDFGVN